MTPIDPAGYTQASTAVHFCAGAALLALGTTEALSADNNLARLRFLAPAAVILSAALMMVSMLFFLGGWQPARLHEALRLKEGFYIFQGFAWFFAAAGLSLLMAALMQERGGPWQIFFLALLCAIGALCFAVHSRVDEAAREMAAARHAAMGATILAAALFRSVYFFVKKKALFLAWSALLLAAAGQMLIYREAPTAFCYGAVTAQSAATSPAVR